MSEKPGRYQRSSNGLIGALIVTLLAIGAFVLVRSLTRADVEVEREPVDFAAAAEAARGAGFDVVAPAALPDGWIATAVDLEQTDPPLWGLGVLTDDGRVRRVSGRRTSRSTTSSSSTSTRTPSRGRPARRSTASSARTWQTWTDEGGDTGYSIEYGDQTVLVYGSAPAADLQEFIAPSRGTCLTG